MSDPKIEAARQTWREAKRRAFFAQLAEDAAVEAVEAYKGTSRAKASQLKCKAADLREATVAADKVLREALWAWRKVEPPSGDTAEVIREQWVWEDRRK